MPLEAALFVDQGNAQIVVRADVPQRRARYLACHELAHLWLQAHGLVDPPHAEAQADALACYLLAPERALLASFLRRGFAPDQIAEDLCAPRAVVLRRLVEVLDVDVRELVARGTDDVLMIATPDRILAASPAAQRAFRSGLVGDSPGTTVLPGQHAVQAERLAQAVDRGGRLLAPQQYECARLDGTTWHGTSVMVRLVVDDTPAGLVVLRTTGTISPCPSSITDEPKRVGLVAED